MKFNDASGKAWAIDINFGAVLRVKKGSEGKYDLLAPEALVAEDRTLCELLRDDYEAFFDVVWCLIAPQAEAAGYSPSDLAEKLPAETIAKMHVDFGKEWEDFFRSLNRPEKAEAVRAVWALHQAAAKAILKQLQSPEYQRLQNKALEKLDQALNNFCGSLEERLDSILEVSPGASST